MQSIFPESLFDAEHKISQIRLVVSEVDSLGRWENGHLYSAQFRCTLKTRSFFTKHEGESHVHDYPEMYKIYM